MSMLFRRQMMTHEDVHFVNALIGDGKAWLTTEETVDSSIAIKCRFILPSVSKTMILFGISGIYPRGFQIVFRTDSQIRFDVDSTNNRLFFATTYDNQAHVFQYQGSTGAVIYDGTQKGTLTSSGLDSEGFNNKYMAVFGQNGGAGTNYVVDQNTICNAKLLEFTMEKSGVEVVHLRPALDGNGIPCMYDTVKKVYRYNMNSQGQFTYE